MFRAATASGIESNSKTIDLSFLSYSSVSPLGMVISLSMETLPKSIPELISPPPLLLLLFFFLLSSNVFSLNSHCFQPFDDLFTAAFIDDKLIQILIVAFGQKQVLYLFKLTVAKRRVLSLGIKGRAV